jgi:hypothetical protein
MQLFGKRATAPVEDVEENEIEETEETEETTQPPQYATVADMQAMIEAQGLQMQNTLQTLLTPREAPQVAAAPEFVPEVSEDDMLQALEEGDHRKVLKLQAQQRRRDQQVSEYELNRLRQEGSQWIGNVNERIVREKLPSYDKYEKEIQGVLKQFPANVRGNADVIQFVYNSVRGSHMDEELAERVEQEIKARKRAANLDQTGDPSPNRGAGSGRRYQTEDEPYFSRTAMDALRAVGRSQDEQAKKLGYESWEAYEKSAQEYAEKYENNHGHRWATRKK